MMSTIRASGFTVRITPFMIPAKGSSNPKSVVSVMIEFGTKANAYLLPAERISQSPALSKSRRLDTDAQHPSPLTPGP